MFSRLSLSNVKIQKREVKTTNFSFTMRFTTFPGPSPHSPSPPFYPPSPEPTPPPPPTPPPFPPTHPHPPYPHPPEPSPIPPVLTKPQFVFNAHKPFEDLKFENLQQVVHYSRNGAKEEKWEKYDSFPVKLLPNFLSEIEQQKLFSDIEPRLRKRRYETAHWDYAIAGYREVTLKEQWLSKESEEIINRLKGEIFRDGVNALPVHILDIEENGFLKPHIDSVLFSGGIVSGLTLLSTAVMTLQPQTFKTPHPVCFSSIFYYL